ncbi:proteoglycan 4-like [Dermacentor albipictus]|uniref:proteoglycan 4-like n=1 Tax=Dermacentor albipictus TaxID=60249 RepID=UPI0031FE2A76
MSKQDRPSRKRHDSVADPRKIKKDEEDSGLGPSTSRAGASGTATEVPKVPAAAPSRPTTRQSHAKSTPEPTAPETTVKSALKTAVWSSLTSPSPTPPSLGAIPKKVAARTAEGAKDQSEATPTTEVQGPSDPTLRVFHEPPEVLEEEGIPKKAASAAAEDVPSQTSETPDSPIPSTSFTVQATIQEPPSSDPSPP